MQISFKFKVHIPNIKLFLNGTFMYLLENKTQFKRDTIEFKNMNNKKSKNVDLITTISSFAIHNILSEIHML